MSVQWEVFNPRLYDKAIESTASAARLGQNPEIAKLIDDQATFRPLLGSPWTTWNTKVKGGGSTANIASSAQYQYDGSYINLEGTVNFGGAPTAGNLSIDLPVAIVEPVGIAGGAYFEIGDCVAQSQGVANGPMGKVVTSHASLSVANFSTAPTTGGFGLWTATVPWTWKNLDQMTYRIRYRWV